MDRIETVDVPSEIFEVSSTSSEEIEEIQEEINDKLIRKFQTNHVKYKYLLNFKRWPIFEFLNLEFILQIRMAMIFYGKLVYDRAILIVTRDKMVYGFGNNTDNCLGIEDNIVTLWPEKVQVLCGKNIKKFICREHGPQMFALTEEGEVYSWGDARNPGLGHAFNADDDRVRNGVRIPTQISLLSKKCITDIKCSDFHTLALTNDGEVYIWGLVNMDIDDHKIINYIPYFCDTPKQVDFNGKKIVQIACGNFFNMALSDENKVYSWGDDIVDNLLGNNILILHQPVLNPHQIELSEEKAIKLVCCGDTYTLALTIEGEVYGWGSNDYIQTGLNKKSNLNYPTLLDMPEKVLDIAIAQDSKSSIILGNSGCIYIWGMKEYFGQMCFRPTITSFLNMSEALMFINMPLTVFADDFKYMDEEIDVLKSWETLFDNPSSSDLIIQVEGQLIHVHKIILKKRSSYFKTLFEDDLERNQIKRKKKEKDVIQHFGYSYIVYKAFLKYLYTDIVDLPMEELQKLLNLAIAYCENELEKYCTLEMKRNYHNMFDF